MSRRRTTNLSGNDGRSRQGWARPRIRGGDAALTMALSDLAAGRAGAGRAGSCPRGVYARLHALAEHSLRQESPGHTLQPTGAWST